MGSPHGDYSGLISLSLYAILAFCSGLMLPLMNFEKCLPRIAAHWSFSPLPAQSPAQMFFITWDESLSLPMIPPSPAMMSLSVTTALTMSSSLLPLQSPNTPQGRLHADKPWCLTLSRRTYTSHFFVRPIMGLSPIPKLIS